MKRRNFLAAIAAAAVSTKIKLPTEGALNATAVDALYTSHIWHDETVAHVNHSCPNCGHYGEPIAFAFGPHSGVGALSSNDYLPMPSMPSIVQGCSICVDKLRIQYAKEAYGVV